MVLSSKRFVQRREWAAAGMMPKRVVLTIAPTPALRIEDTTAWIPRYVPVRLMSITWRQVAGSVSAIGPTRTMAALLTSTETGPKAFSAATTDDAQSFSFVTSRREKIA